MPAGMSISWPPPFVQERWISNGHSSWCVVLEGKYYPFGSKESCEGVLKGGKKHIEEFSTWSDTFSYNPNAATQNTDTTPLRLEELRQLGEQQKYRAEFEKRLSHWHHVNTDVDMSDFYPKP